VIEASLQAFASILTALNIGFLFAGVVAGLILGAIPGLGGITGLTILLPVVFVLEADSGIILLVALAAVVATGDTIPAVLLGVPGTSGSQATILDGYPMARKGEAGRAFGAAYMSSMIGGIIGALALLAALPILRPLVLSMGSPEFLMVALLGVSMIGTLAAASPFIGIALGLFGIMLSMVGMHPMTGAYRWTFGQTYLMEGIPYLPVILGLFAIPELMELIGRGTTIAEKGKAANITRDLIRGIKDSWRNWFLVIRCGVIGTYIGVIPGLGASVVDWIAYGHAAQSVRNPETLGHGDVRGVIAPESANNARHGGALIPTIAFGVPGSPVMVILLGALMMAGITPGPYMLTTHLHTTVTIVCTTVYSNIMACLTGLLFTRQIARLCYVPVQILVPLVLVAVFVASLQATALATDLLVLLVFGLLGWILKKLRWPRVPLVLGFILGPILDKYFFISYQAMGFGWLTRPGVLIIGALLIGTLTYASYKTLRGGHVFEEA
jgi:putative tricarboxylic transport membrane protein